jgi:hypothetical protein
MENSHMLDGVRSSSGSRSIKHTAAAIKEKRGNSTTMWFGI